MTLKVAIIYNDPLTDEPGRVGEKDAVLAVLGEVSAVRRACQELNYGCEVIALHRPLEEMRRTLSQMRTDIIFNMFEGFGDDPYSEAEVAAMIEEMGLHFTGNSSQVLELTLDKVRTKEVLKKHGIVTPDYQMLTPQNLSEFRLAFPCIAKPRDMDASHGLLPESVVHNRQQLEKQVRRISSEFRGCALVEEFIDGREFNASVIGNKGLELIEISEILYSLLPELPRILTFDSKWAEDTPYCKGTVAECPAQVSLALREMIKNVVLNSCRAVGVKGYARVDMRQDAGGNIRVLEVNANPDLSPELGIALQAEKHGWSYTHLIQKIISVALES